MLNSAMVRAETRPNFLSIYFDYLQKIADCKSLECYQNVLKQTGSASTISTLAIVKQGVINQTFAIDKKRAQDRILRRDQFTVVSESAHEDSATLTLNDQQYPSLNSTIYFRFESGNWKIGQ